MKSKFSSIKKSGFTILEMLIVLTIVAIILPTVFAIVFIILRQQVRIYRVVETRRQGDYILSFIKDKLIRTQEMNNATAPYSTTYCNGSGSSFQADNFGNDVTFLDRDNVRFKIYQTGTNLNFQDIATGLTTALNTTNVAIVANSFNIDCFRRGTYSSPLITVAFDITFIDNTPTTQEGTTTFHYQTKIKLRDVL